jgi:L-asparagine transporter-like permease
MEVMDLFIYFITIILTTTLIVFLGMDFRKSPENLKSFKNVKITRLYSKKLTLVLFAVFSLVLTEFFKEDKNIRLICVIALTYLIINSYRKKDYAN